MTNTCARDVLVWVDELAEFPLERVDLGVGGTVEEEGLQRELTAVKKIIKE